MLSVNRALATLLALALALLAGCRPKEDTCHSPSIRCGDKCVDASRDPANCGNCGVTCGASQTCCGSCVDLQADVHDCGACGHSCLGPGVASTDAWCAAGVCQCANTATAKDCGGTCVNTTTDRAHCGDCTTACTFPGSQCQGGACGCFPPDPVECTSAVSSHPACTNLFDPQNCGTCGASCTLPGKTSCPAGSCACNSGSLTDCVALGCFDTNTDAAHCGGCGSACTAGQLCCAANCKTVATDNSNCGSCGNVCASPKTCVSGSCACPGATPTACGANCCAGNACCTSNACQTQHFNGLNAPFFDCHALYTPGPNGTTTQQAATLAAESWAAGTTVFPLCDGSCVGRQTGSACAIWCFAPSTFGGHVTSGSTSACSSLCPNFFGTTPTWQ
jgi:hypothetical protein